MNSTGSKRLLASGKEKCSLKCQNGSTCTSKNTGSSSWGTMDGMHCECPKGFAGVHCEYTAKICGVGEHMCLGNSTCVKDDNGYRCECDQANNDTGRSCQHHDTEFCTPAAPHIEYSGGMAIAAFCVNDGKCNDVVLGGEVYPVCECPPPYTGSHCELIKPDDAGPAARSYIPKIVVHSKLSDQPKPGLVLLLVFLSATLLVLCLFAGRQIRRVRRRRREAIASSTNLQGFRDGGADPKVNFAVSTLGRLHIPGFVEQRGTSLKRKDSKRVSNLSQTRSDLFERQVYRTASFNRRGVQRSDSYDAPGGGKFTHSDKGKLHDIQFV